MTMMSNMQNSSPILAPEEMLSAIVERKPNFIDTLYELNVSISKSGRMPSKM